MIYVLTFYLLLINLSSFWAFGRNLFVVGEKRRKGIFLGSLVLGVVLFIDVACLLFALVVRTALPILLVIFCLALVVGFIGAWKSKVQRPKTLTRIIDYVGIFFLYL